MEDIKIFIVAHKESEFPKIDGYFSLLVGAKGKMNVSNFDYVDDQGENISDKNPYYCELTGIYWIWKHINADVVGLCHYRRFFTESRFSKDPKHYLTKKTIQQVLHNYDVIVPERLYYKKNINDAVRVAPNKEDLDEMGIAIKELFPDYVEDYVRYLNQKSTFLFNMCIMRKDIFDQYCEWLFSVLKYIEDRHDITKEEGYRSRLFGFLSERLIYVWIVHNVNPKKIKEIRVVRTDMGNSKQIIKDVKNYIKKIIT